MRRLLVLGLLAGLLVGAVLIVRARATDRETQRPNVRVETISRGDLTLTVTATGTMTADRSARLSFRQPGIVQEVLVEEGDQVQEGQVLALLDDTALRLLVVQAEAGLRAAQLSLDQALAPPSDRDLDLAQANIEAARGAYTALFAPFSRDAVRAAELRYEQALAAAQAAEQRQRDAGGRVPLESTTYQLAMAQAGQAAFSAELARLQLELLRRGPDQRAVAAAQARIDEAQVQLERLQAGIPPAQIEQLRLAVEQAEIALEQARLQQENAILRAPFAGTVTQVLVRPGMPAASSLPAIVLVDTAHLYVNARVDEIDIGLLAPGQPASLTFDALPGQIISGVIDRIALAASQDAAITAYDVRVALAGDEVPMRARAGMTASISVVIREVQDVVRVPNLFVRLDRRTDQAFVNIVNPDGTLSEIPITLGLRSDEYSEVIAGLDEGDQVGISLDVDLLSLF
jgi:HlyD family secretion protein